MGEISVIVEAITQQQNEKGHRIYWEKNKVFRSNDLTIGEALAMAAGELVGEAMEAYRDNNLEKFEEELADAVLRIFHIAGATKRDLESAIKRKLAQNKERPFKHGRVNF
jgi:NTP pyrophosphatase (non-canonical NTP hydrolase)